MKSRAFLTVLLLAGTPCLAARPASAAASGSTTEAVAPLIDWPEFFSFVRPARVEISAKLRQLDGKRVRLRGHSLLEPQPRGGVFLTRLPAGRLHPDDFDTLPWDAVAVLWRPGLELPQIPNRPTVEGVLRLGNRQVEGENVFLLLEDAVPAPQCNSGE